jgi:pyridoxamine 5'-phosphate oxidase
MDFQEIVNFANETEKATHVCYLATVDGDQPYVRPISLWFADKTGFYFQTETPKTISKHLQKNNKVQICFMGKEGKVMRITGKTEFVTDKALRTKIMEERAYLKHILKGPDDPLLVLFKVYTGEAYIWTMANNMKEAEIERVKF